MENQNNYEYEEIEVDIKELFEVIINKIGIIILATLFAAIIAFALSKFYISPKYESTTKIYLIAKNEDTNNITTSDLQLSSQLTNDYMTLVKSRPVLEKVISDLNLDTNPKNFANLISVSNPNNTRIIIITTKYSEPETAKAIADSVRTISAEHIQNIMDLEEVNVVEEGNLPENPTSPNVLLNTIIGAVLGTIISTLIILIIYFLDDTIKSPDDVERHLGLSVLGSIPIQDDEASVRNKKNKRSSRKTKKVKKSNFKNR